MARGTAAAALLWHICCTVRLLSAQEVITYGYGVNGFSLHPPYFNLAEGTKIIATATCGQDESGKPVEDLYCKLVGGPVSGDPSQTIQGQYCDICKAESNKAHPSTNAIDGTERWWQSPPLSRGLEYNEVNVTLDLGQLFHVAYVLIKFANSPRPDLWVLERSTDFGETYSPWQYFASSKRDCIEKFGPKSVERIIKDDDAICTMEYSRIVPLENGEIVVSLVNGRPGAMNFSYSPVLRDFTKATNIRLRFLRTNTLLGHLMGKALRDPTVTRRYYYSIKDISIGGRCVCNGHADVCDAKDLSNPYRLQCDCQHNTCGVSCDHCCPGYNQLPWKPATIDSANECEPCNCNGHAFECVYDPEVDERKGSLNSHGRYEGGGVCINCQDNTSGVNCERCVRGYYRAPDLPADSVNACLPCNCNSEFTEDACEDNTGRCYCKYNYAGENCDYCAEGYYNFPNCYPLPVDPTQTTGALIHVGKIINCDCSATGTQNNDCQPDPSTGHCNCKPNFTGRFCKQCMPHHFGANCQPCRCLGPGVTGGSCNEETGQCICRQGFEGFYCDQCAPGYFNYPLCQLCSCSIAGSLPEVCDHAGRCLCKPEFDGARCDQCATGFHSYPRCHACSCDVRGSVDNFCGSTGQCQCHPSYAGPMCNQCAPGFYGYPSCTACRCTLEGSYINSCDQETGRCSCRPLVTGLHCDTCVEGAYGFPDCQVTSCDPAGSTSLSSDIESCQCRENVEGSACDKCKPLYWNLSIENPWGCTSCQCHIEGTLSGVAECLQSDGQCFCKPNVCTHHCTTCKAGYYNLNHGNYFGCQGCQCDTGGSVGSACGDRSGSCQCRQNIEGRACNQARPDHYFPDLHHLGFEIEDGTTPDGRAVRFGFNPLEFENFSWRGYAQMSPIQNRVKIMMHVMDSELYLFRFILRYINAGSATVFGKVTAYQGQRPGSEQTKQIIFAPSAEPTFVTVPQNTFVEPFVLNPGAWSVVIEAEGILLDYLVLLPSAYYEAPILQLKVTEPCTYTRTPQDTTQNCLMYRHLPLDGFPSVVVTEGMCAFDNYLHSQCQVVQPTPRHPLMVLLNAEQVNVQMVMRVPHSGTYVVLIEYATETDPGQSISVHVNALGGQQQPDTIRLNYCKYSFLCHGVAIDSLNRVAVYELPTNVELQIIADSANILLNKVYLIPHEQFTMEYILPGVHCISTHGTFAPDSGSCTTSRFQKPSQSIILTEGEISSPSTLLHLYPVRTLDRPQQPPIQPRTIVDTADLILLRSPQTVATFSSRIPTLGRYAFVIHFYQPEHPSYPTEVLINGGRIWQGHVNTSFCPHGYGCRSSVFSENKIILDITDNDVSVIIRVPDGKTLWLDYILIIPEASYNSNYLVEEPLDKSYDFISTCGGNSFYINPRTASKFCKDSVVSLAAFYNNGALPCMCHEVGATSSSCDPFGGQCNCRPNVIGRDCSRCATGYYGFPNCRPCNCGKRLCEEVTGHCICPPRTIQPECIVCEPQTFGCHPLVGCEECNCSHSGIRDRTRPGCNSESGQCRCKPNITGRRCDRCAPGYYHYPDCMPCNCNEAGTQASICDSVTGQCHCKENVEGPQCDTCRLGTFYLDPANPKGCTSCFCFGATDRCQISNKRRTALEHTIGWKLMSSDRQELLVTPSPEDREVAADVADISQELYWQAPPPYLGDQISSYGGYLMYQLRSEVQRGDIISLPVESRPDVILKGNQMTIMYVAKDYPAPGELHESRLQLVESNFRHAQTHNPVSREEMMMVLANLDGLQIRALHSQLAKLVALRNVILEQASDAGEGSVASNVEICHCPANYMGDSCQDCSPGYYRDTKGLFLGKCVPCNCNGHSDQCLDGSGICVNCQHNTEGENCERCKTGLVENATVGAASLCVQCPCPLTVSSNNFAKDCINHGDRTQCLCKPGYAGLKCERCAPGYFGNPMVLGSECQPCDCNSNTDSNMLFSNCDSLTGICLGCMHNTAGPHCELCAPGFYGDAVVAKDCAPCNCSPCGTESCDDRTGECQCKPGVTGPHCDQCEAGYYGYDSCAGCQKCSCHVASQNKICDIHTGQCPCMPGVTGLQCQHCAPGYWNYSSHGCRRCNCNGGSCNPRTGDCTCNNGLGGRQCDTCLQMHQIPVVDHLDSMKCESCDSCVVTLLEDLNRTAALLPDIKGQLSNLTASSIVWARMNALSDNIGQLSNELSKQHASQDQTKDYTDELETDSMNLIQDLVAYEEKVTVINKEVVVLGESIDGTHQRANGLLNSITDLKGTIIDLIDQMNETQLDTSMLSPDEFVQKLAEVEKLLKEMRGRNFSSQHDIADSEEEEAKKLLERVEKLEKPLRDVKDLVESLSDKLLMYNMELMDLRDALNEAVNKTGQANEKNNINEHLLAENMQKVDELEDRYNQVKEVLKMASDSLAQVSDLLQMFDVAKEEYDRLAAMLDGARMPLIEKVKKFSPASSKIPIIERAEEHARFLDELAKNLSRAIEDTNQDGFIQRAVNASNAYAGIIEAVERAKAAAKEADEAAMKALKQVMDEDLAQQAADLKKTGTLLEKEATKAQKKSEEELKPKLKTLKERLEDAKAKKEQLLSQLTSLEDMLKDINRGDISDYIASAKQRAAIANRTAVMVQNTLVPMKKNLEQWREKYGGAPSDSEEFNKTLQEANKSVAALNETIPLLLDKLNKLEVRNQTANISASIDRIRVLISQARNAANKVKVPMKFNGTSGVQVRSPSNPDDLRAYTSLTFYIQREPAQKRKRKQATSSSSQFVLYLGGQNPHGDYMGVAMKNGKLVWVYKLGSEEATLQADSDVSSDRFDTVKLERILQYGQISYSIEKGTVTETKGNGFAKGDAALLNLSPEDVVFYVGGYPSEFTPPETLKYPNFKGCIELGTLNAQVISLYNLVQTFDLNTTADEPCRRFKSTQGPDSDSAYFDGTGYAEIKMPGSFSSVSRFEQEVRIVSYSGILFFMQEKEKYLSLTIDNGKLVLFVYLNNELKIERNSESQNLLSDGFPHQIQIIMVFSKKVKIYVRVDRKTVLSSERDASRPSISEYYLGGVPAEKLPDNLRSQFPTGGSIKGCMRSVKALDKNLDLKREKTIGISYGCSANLLVSRSADFKGQGYLSLIPQKVPMLRNNFISGFGFQTQQRNALMFYYPSPEGNCQVSLKQGLVTLKVFNTEVKSQTEYTDGSPHYVSFSITNEQIKMTIDDQEKQESNLAKRKRRQSGEIEKGQVYLGGVPGADLSANLTGCISNVFIYRKDSDEQSVVDLQKHKVMVGAELNSCPSEKPPQQIRSHKKEKSRQALTKLESKQRVSESCQLPKQPAIGDAHYFRGSHLSRLEYDNIPDSFQMRSRFSLEVLCNSSHGMLFYVSNELETSFMALLVSKGRFVFLFDIKGKRLRIPSKEKCTDGKWHTIFFGRDRNQGQLVIDGLRVQSSTISVTAPLDVRAPFYVGAVPKGKARKIAQGIPAAKFSGCIRKFQLDGKVMDPPSRTYDVAPCFEQNLETGTFFSVADGYLIIDESFNFGKDYELMIEVRPRSLSGVLFHVGRKRSLYFSLYIENGKVIAQLNNGAGEFSTSVIPQQSLCDGQWHRIAVIKRMYAIQLDVDTNSNHTVGPFMSPHINPKETLYLGGVPETVQMSLLSSIRYSFVGCVKNLVINQKLVQLNRPGSIYGGISTSGCPLLYVRE
ncbi:laminin subunit alpha-5 isoform X2 [Stegostoma tigrinum]|uniref:laminin subunit alpha-5 isoform X2 n=1 Tax=Stegostoma tigrinum TaxID=3053191 RepID=UPI0028702273|nr:laminin subunit alpha-5 isoform X2 [Stegostoma tigrinum]